MCAAVCVTSKDITKYLGRKPERLHCLQHGQTQALLRFNSQQGPSWDLSVVFQTSLSEGGVHGCGCQGERPEAATAHARRDEKSLMGF